MNKTIKIGLIALAVIAIAGVLWLTLKTPSDPFPPLQFDDSYFVSQVESQCKAEIDSAASFQDAQSVFNYLLQDVQDAAYLENISTSESTNSKKLLAYHFGPVLASHADSVFAGHEWNESHINALKDEAQIVLGTDMIEHNSDTWTKLNGVVKNVNDYHAAKAAAKCGRCNSVRDVQAAIKNADKFKREAPLNNCRSLMSELDAVKRKAKEKLAQNIISDCNKAASGHGSIDAARARIHEYERTFGGERQFAEAKSKLNAAERNHSSRHDNTSTSSSSSSHGNRHKSHNQRQHQTQQDTQQPQPISQERRIEREFEFE